MPVRKPLGAVARRLVLNPVVAGAGYALVSLGALAWGATLGGFRVSRHQGLIICQGLPSWAFGRGGTTVGAVYLTAHTVSPQILTHESVHQAQWRRYGMALIPLYLLAGRDPHHNRFEVAAGLESGGYA
jgi:hypothetical protein